MKLDFNKGEQKPDYCLIKYYVLGFAPLNLDVVYVWDVYKQYKPGLYA